MSADNYRVVTGEQYGGPVTTRDLKNILKKLAWDLCMYLEETSKGGNYV